MTDLEILKTNVRVWSRRMGLATPPPITNNLIAALIAEGWGIASRRTAIYITVSSLIKEAPPEGATPKQLLGYAWLATFTIYEKSYIVPGTDIPEIRAAQELKLGFSKVSEATRERVDTLTARVLGVRTGERNSLGFHLQQVLKGTPAH